MDRRELLKVASSAALGVIASNVMANEHEHHHDSGQHSHHANPNQSLLDTTGTCIQRGEVCVNHCLMLLADGEKEMAACARSVHEMLAICTALQKLASYESKQLSAMAKLAMNTCQACEDECRKHEKKHAACHDCAEACAACYKECKAIAA